MMLRYTLNEGVYADQIEAATKRVVTQGKGTADLSSATDVLTTSQLGDAIVAEIKAK